MKNIKQIRENYNVIMEKEEADLTKLTSLIRAGLFDQKKLPIIKRALSKDPSDLTLAERKILLELLNSLMSEVLSSSQAYRSVRQGVMHEEINEAKNEYLSKFDPRADKNWPSESDIPTVLILKRKAIRVYPDYTKVALYYAQAIDKYVSIPFSGINTSVNFAEELVLEKSTVPPKDKDVDKKDKESEAAKVIRQRREREDRIQGKSYVGSDQKTKNDIYQHVKDKVRHGKDDIYQKAAHLGATMALGGARKVATASSNAVKGYKYHGAKSRDKLKYIPRNDDNSMSKIKNSTAHKLGSTVAKTVSAAKKVVGLSEEEKTVMNEFLLPTGKAAQKFLFRKSKPDTAPATKPAPAPATKPAPAPATKPAPAPATKPAPAPATKTNDKPKTDTKAKPKPSLGSRIANRVSKAIGIGGAVAAGAAAALSGASDDKDSNRDPKGFSLKAKIHDPKASPADSARRERERKKLFSESIVDKLRNINEETSIQIADNHVYINKIIAEKIINVYDSLNEENQKKVNKLINEDVDGFKKFLNFVVRQ
jgi:hypothetical protein